MLPHLKFRTRPPSWSDKKHPCPSSLARVFFYVHSTQSHTEISDRQLGVFHKNRLHTPIAHANGRHEPHAVTTKFSDIFRVKKRVFT
jgi:hypothetical protein